MILVSCRKNFDSNQEFDTDLKIRQYPNLSDLTKFNELTEGQLLDAVKHLHVLVLVHGYRNPLKNVASSYKKLETEMTTRGLIGAGNYDMVIGFVWPGFQTVVGFFLAVPWANRSASHFRALIKLLNSAAKTVDVQTHSLGARVALQTMAFPKEVWIDNLLLTAPAVDDEVLEPKREFHESLQSCRRCFVYHSTHDPVLHVTYKLGSLDAALGDKGPEHPKIVQKDCPEVFVVDCSLFVKDHGAYRQTPQFYDQWAKVLAEVPLPRFDKLK